MVMKVCAVSGDVCDCTQCPLVQANRAEKKKSTTERGYNNAWRRLSERARKLQPWCSTCGSKYDLTADHLRWPARTLKDVDVLCRSCNSAKGKAEGRDEYNAKQSKTGAEAPGAMTLDDIDPDPPRQPSSFTQFMTSHGSGEA